MTESAPSWDHYRSFLAVLRGGSLSAAARTLGLKQPTVGRHIDALEETLRVPLFTRGRDGLAPTDAAIELKPLAENMASIADALVRTSSAAAADVRGTVRISASDMIGSQVLPPILAKLHRAHPGLTVELVLNNRVDDLLRREADIAVRMVQPKQAALVARRIGDIVLGLHAHRDYLKRRGTPQSIADLADHDLIGFDVNTAFVRVLREYGLPLRREQFALRTDSDIAQLAAIAAGHGIGVCQVNLARRNPDLVPVLAKAFAYPLQTWVVMHEDLRNAARCRVAFDALTDGLTEYVKPRAARR
jgi:DNA-binding transcriptional LysR family regulator